MASADFSLRLAASPFQARGEISPGMTHLPSRLCLSDLRHVVCASTGLWQFWLPHPNVSPRIRFLFVRPAFCFRLPPDVQSPETPLPSANPSPCRVDRGLTPPSRCALPGAPKKEASPEGGLVTCVKGVRLRDRDRVSHLVVGVFQRLRRVAIRCRRRDVDVAVV